MAAVQNSQTDSDFLDLCPAHLRPPLPDSPTFVKASPFTGCCLRGLLCNLREKAQSQRSFQEELTQEGCHHPIPTSTFCLYIKQSHPARTITPAPKPLPFSHVWANGTVIAPRSQLGHVPEVRRQRKRRQRYIKN